MSAEPPTSREVDSFRDRADSFIRDLDEEYYHHFAGLKETLDVEQVYERLRRADEARDRAER